MFHINFMHQHLQNHAATFYFKKKIIKRYSYITYEPLYYSIRLKYFFYIYQFIFNIKLSLKKEREQSHQTI